MVSAERRLSGADETSKTAGGSGASHSPLRYPASLARRGPSTPSPRTRRPGRARSCTGRRRSRPRSSRFGESPSFIRRRMVAKSPSAPPAASAPCSGTAHLVLVIDARLQLGTQHIPLMSLPVVPSLESHTHVICRILCLPLESSCARLSAALSALARSFAASSSALAATFSAALRLRSSSFSAALRALAVALPCLVEPLPVPLAHRDDR